jgi:PEGA domain-containing protein
MKKLFGVLLQAFVMSGLAITIACTANSTTGNNNQTAGNTNTQTSGNSNEARSQSSADKSAPKAEQAGTGSIEVRSSPPGARVILISLDEDGAEPQQRGSTPTILTGVPVGKYTIDIEKPGYKFYQKNIKVEENKTVEVSAPLRKE